MADIVISGNTSGSVTLRAPDVSGTTLLTLPTSSGTLVVTGGAQTVQFAAGSAAAPSITFTGDTNTGIYSPAADTIAFTEGGVESMRIDSSGNVSIGRSATSGGERLGVTTSNALVIDMDSTAANGGYMRYTASGTTYGYIGTATGIIGSGGTNALALRSENAMMFATGGPAERMRITSGGDLLVGTTSPIGPARVAVSQSTTGWAGFACSHTLGAGQPLIVFANAANNAIIGTITNNGNTAVSYNTTSDYRLKENITPMTGALDKVAQLKPVTYNWKVDSSAGQGFIAHELQAVVPDCVTGEKDAVDEEGNPRYQGVDTSFLVATLTAAIQELNAKVEAQAAEIAALKGVK